MKLSSGEITMDPEQRPLSVGAIRTSEDGSHASEPLLPTADDAAPAPNAPDAGSRSVLMRLYVSHTLSAWNSRMFEFGAVLFLASIFPDTLLYASIYALVRALSAVALSSWLGERVDSLDRLVAVRHSIGMCCVDWVSKSLAD